MDSLPDLPNGPVTVEALLRHADAIEAHAAQLQPAEARQWQEDAAHIRDAANRMRAAQGAIE